MSEGWRLGLLAVMAVADAEQAELRAEVERLRARLARMTGIARERGDALNFADDHIPAWHAIRDERDALRGQVRRGAQNEEWLRRERDALRAQVAAVRAAIDRVDETKSATVMVGAIRAALSSPEPVTAGEPTKVCTTGHVKVTDGVCDWCGLTVTPPDEPNPCGHETTQRGCGGCDPGAIEFVKDDGGPWVRVTPPAETFDPREQAAVYLEGRLHRPGALIEAMSRAIRDETVLGSHALARAAYTALVEHLGLFEETHQFFGDIHPSRRLVTKWEVVPDA